MPSTGALKGAIARPWGPNCNVGSWRSPAKRWAAPKALGPRSATSLGTTQLEEEEAGIVASSCLHRKRARELKKRGAPAPTLVIVPGQQSRERSTIERKVSESEGPSIGA